MDIRQRGYLAVLFFLLYCLDIPQAFAGGYFLRDSTLNGQTGVVQVPQKSVAKLCYHSTDYFFSGHGRDYSYLIFMLNQPFKLTGSVGREGDNRPADVRVIKKALQKVDIYRGEINGNLDQQLIDAIEHFQQNFAGQTPDGRVDPRGKTSRILNIEIADAFFVKLNRQKTTEADDIDPYHIQDCVYFEVPGAVAEYTVHFSRAPFIIDYPIGTEVQRDGKEMIVLNINEQRMVKKLFRDYHPSTLMSFQVVPSGTQNVAKLATYLRVNDAIPDLQTLIKPGESEKPLTFSWHTRPVMEDVEFRYRLHPDQPEWTPWSKRTAVDYFFLGIGSHDFAVETRYRDTDGSWVNVPESDYRFYLEAPFISQPVIYKAQAGNVAEAVQPLPDFQHLYTDSQALLIGVSDFADPTLPPLPFVKQDVTRMQQALGKQGFQVTTVSGSKTRNEIVTALDNFISGLKSNDRALVYFSTHGFQDKVVKSRAYLAAADCDTSRPNLHCLELTSLENMFDRALQIPVRHLLVVLDTCSAGLGVITKSPEYQELNVAVEPGAHMITAGLADQKAEMDIQRKMSTFTWYFTEGLEGAADYTKDNIITLTELLMYTRYNVARKTKGAQTPMIGRLKGPGEMVFTTTTQ